MVWIKTVLIILNTFLSSGALIALILYVKKTAEIAKLSEKSTEDLSKTTIVSKKAVELSRNVLLEMVETRKLLTAPLVVSYFERIIVDKNSYIFFVLENIGNGVAKNIKYDFSPQLVGEGKKDIARIIKLGEHIDSLPPKYQMRNLLGRVGHYIDLESPNNEEINTELPRKFEVTITYQDAITNEKLINNFFLDLRIPLGNCPQ